MATGSRPSIQAPGTENPAPLVGRGFWEVRPYLSKGRADRAAIDAQCRAADIGAMAARKIDDGGGDLLGTAEAADIVRHHVLDAAAFDILPAIAPAVRGRYLFQELLHRRHENGARRDDVGGDARILQPPRQRHREIVARG